jgi:hypothetical protein
MTDQANLGPRANAIATLIRVCGSISRPALVDRLKRVRTAMQEYERDKATGAALAAALAPAPGPLGPATEAALAAAFRGRAIITARATARVLGMDVKTLRRLTDRGTIWTTQRGDLDGYTEGAIRDFLSSPPPAPPAAADPPKATRPKRAPDGKVYSFNTHHRQRR